MNDSLLDFSQVFDSTYLCAHSKEQARADFEKAKRLVEDQKSFYTEMISEQNVDRFDLRLFSKKDRLTLSKIISLFNDFGIEVVKESEYLIQHSDQKVYLQDFTCHFDDQMTIKADDIKDHDNFLNIFESILSQEIECDVLNQLVFKAKLDRYDLNAIRGLLRALHQMHPSLPFDLSSKLLVRYPPMVQLFKQYWQQKFDPKIDQKDRQEFLKVVENDIFKAFESAATIDHEQGLRQIFTLLQAMVRTNFFLYKPYISFKFASQQIPYLPKPHPLYEIFVYAPWVEGVHLRSGKVARGGIRWSTRSDDYRYEILDLVKAQIVKNAIIVPLGAKGGFFCRQYDTLLHQGVSFELLKQQIIRCYQTFITALLEITDSIKEGKIVRHSKLVTFDEEDPYLVVAADKGTSSFSDMANSISKEADFWLDDAFASGGSQGYDHKKMAITSKGAWISLKEHLNTFHLYPDTMPCRCVGVGDMSGDVFGNGLLRSDQIQLVAAFDDRHIFIDPNPDLKKSYQERLRLFHQKDSSWADYSTEALSKGGMIIPRSQNHVQLTEEAKKLFKISFETGQHGITGEELIQCILKSEVDFIWFGGIGTYVKSCNETHADAHDHVNDRVRVDASSLKAKVIVEGANLAMTQKARVDFALLGGKINTDAIDNSAGVSCSDHEVNIKILLRQRLENRTLTIEQRNIILQEIQDDVESLVLKDNEEQNKILSKLEHLTIQDEELYGEFLNFLEHDPLHPVEARLHALPSVLDLKQRHKHHKKLTRPEYAILIAHMKILIFKHIIEQLQQNAYDKALKKTDVFHQVLNGYFPKKLQDQFQNDIQNHPLAKEIFATVLSNLMVNTIGPFQLFILLDWYHFDYIRLSSQFYQWYTLFGDHHETRIRDLLWISRFLSLKNHQTATLLTGIENHHTLFEMAFYIKFQEHHPDLSFQNPVIQKGLFYLKESLFANAILVQIFKNPFVNTLQYRLQGYIMDDLFKFCEKLILYGLKDPSHHNKRDFFDLFQESITTYFPEIPLLQKKLGLEHFEKKEEPSHGAYFTKKTQDLLWHYIRLLDEALVYTNFMKG